MKMQHLISILLVVFTLHDICESVKIIDMTHQITTDMPVLPGLLHFKFTKINKIKKPFWVAFNDFEISEHAGTHFDAPYHFDPTKWYLHQVPVERLIAPAVVIDISERSAKEANTPMTPEDLMAWEKENGQIPDGSVILLVTGWQKYWNDPAKYLGNSEANPLDFHHPGVGADAAQWLVDNRKAVGVGVDTISVDVGNVKDFPVHQILAKNSLYILESVANIDQLPAKGAIVHSYPLKIHDGTGSPCRVVGFVHGLEQSLEDSWRFSIR